MKILIVEDEKILALALEAKIMELRPEAQIVGKTTSILSSVEFLNNHKDMDIIFADIKIDDGLSFSIFEHVDTNAMVVFTTAFDEYALKAFEYNCADYLLKPVKLDALERAIEKCEKRLPGISPGQLRTMSIELLHNDVSYRKRLFLDAGSDVRICQVISIAYIYTEMGFTRVYLDDGTWASTEKTLIQLSESLDPSMFFRVNRQAIVNIDYVDRFILRSGRDWSVQLKSPFDGIKFPMSATRKNKLTDILDK